MADAAINCESCSARQIFKPAVIWCQDCSAHLCKSCQEPHDSFKATRNHHTIPIADYKKLPKEVLEITDVCQEHNEKFIIYCQSHSRPCCKKCIIDCHRSCQSIVNLDDVINNFKSSVALHDLEATLQESNENIAKIKTDRLNNLKAIETEHAKALDRIDDIRREINQHLDYLQNKLKTELKQKVETTKKTILDVINSLEQQEALISENLQTLANVKLYASDLQTFLYTSTATLEKQVHKTESRVLDLSSDRSCSSINIDIKLEPAVERFKDQFESFGTLEVRNAPSLVSLKRRKEAEAQMIAQRPSPKPFSNINLTVDKTLDNTISNCFGCCILSKDRMVFTNNSDKFIKILNKNVATGEEVITMPYFPFDVTRVNDTTLAVSCTGNTPSSGIHLIDLPTQKITKSLLTRHWINGIAGHDDDHLIYCERRIGVRKIRISDGSVTDIFKAELLHNCYVTSFGDSVIYTNPEANTVTCHNINGTEKWSFNDETILRYPCGVSTDRNDNVYVAGFDSENLVIISGDGQKRKQIQCGLKKVMCLDYDKTNDKLLAVNLEGKAVVMKQN